MTDLKPCPFCGESEYAGYTLAHHRIYIQCKCSARGPLVQEQHDFTEEGKEQAAKMWNTRPIEDALRQENERLREAVEFAHSEGFEWPTDPFAQIEGDNG